MCAYQPIPISEEGTQKKAVVSEDNVQSLLTDILKELKKMNIHLELITDNQVENTEI